MMLKMMIMMMMTIAVIHLQILHGTRSRIYLQYYDDENYHNDDNDDDDNNDDDYSNRAMDFTALFEV